MGTVMGDVVSGAQVPCLGMPKVHLHSLLHMHKRTDERFECSRSMRFERLLSESSGNNRREMLADKTIAGRVTPFSSPSSLSRLLCLLSVSRSRLPPLCLPSKAVSGLICSGSSLARLIPVGIGFSEALSGCISGARVCLATLASLSAVARPLLAYLSIASFCTHFVARFERQDTKPTQETEQEADRKRKGEMRTRFTAN